MKRNRSPGFPQISAVHGVIAIAVIVLAAIFIAKFGFNIDLISPSSGEMAIVKRPITPIKTLVQSPVVKPKFTFRPETFCPANQTPCGNSCTNPMTDPDNCGFCGKVSPMYNSTDRKCIAEKCSNACLPGYYDCNQNPADGCESKLQDKDNCGRCGNTCASGWFCMVGTCATGGGGPEPYVPSPRL